MTRFGRFLLKSNHSKILVIQTAFIGDMILTTPLINAIKQNLNNSQIDVLTIPSTQNILENNPSVHKIIIYDKKGCDRGLRGFFRITRLIRNEHYHTVISPHRSFKSALLSWCSGAQYRVSFSNSAGFFLYNIRTPYRHSLHEVDRNLALLETFGCHTDGLKPRVYPSKNDMALIDNLVDHGIKAIALAPGSVWATKRWPKEYYRALALALVDRGYTLFLIGGKSDTTLCDEIASGRDQDIKNVAGQLNLLQSSALLHKCRLLVTNDSAPMHLASATDTPVIAIFGPTVHDFGFYPYKVKHKIIEKKLSCRPCSKHGGVHCPIKTFECMKKILPEQMVQEVIQFAENEKRQ